MPSFQDAAELPPLNPVSSKCEPVPFPSSFPSSSPVIFASLSKCLQGSFSRGWTLTASNESARLVLSIVVEGALATGLHSRWSTIP